MKTREKHENHVTRINVSIYRPNVYKIWTAADRGGA